MRDPSENLYEKVLGRAGENRAAAYLKRQGMKVIARNWRTPFGEADVVAKDGDTVVFVEVKTRTNDSFSTPAAAVDAKKRRRYTDMARYYFTLHGAECDVRFDVAEVTKDGVNWLKNAF